MSSSFSSLCFVAFLLSSFIVDGGLAAPKKHVGGSNSFNENRIQGGGDTSQDVFKFIPALLIVAHFGPKMISAPCSSTIISSRHLLTAAHCVVINENVNGNAFHKQLSRLNWIMTDLRPKEIEQRAEFNGSEVVYASISKYGMPKTIIFHPSYNPADGFLYNDLAILEYPEGVNFEKIDPITLAHGFHEKDGDHALAAGYGYYKRKVVGDKIEYELPNVLQNATVALWKNNCPIVEYENMSMEDYEAFICSGTHEVKADHGDSGGPLMVERNETLYQVGVASTCSENTCFYTRLTPVFCDWITKVTNQEVHCKSLPPPDPAKPTPAPKNPKGPNPTAAPQKSQTTTTSASNMVKFNALLILFTFLIFVVL